jgi:hypothetical protein
MFSPTEEISPASLKLAQSGGMHVVYIIEALRPSIDPCR